ncbi:hypothetical protein GCM10027080_24540 [Pedococcus soli]
MGTIRGMELDREGRTDLHYAAADGDLALVRQLLSQGYDVTLADTGGYTPLHLAAQNQQADVVPELVAAGAALEARDQWGNTPLWRAMSSSRGRGETILALLAAGADPDAENNHGTSPRIGALRIANYDVAQYFVDLTSSRAS